MTTYYDNSIVFTQLKYLAFLLILMGNNMRWETCARKHIFGRT